MSVRARRAVGAAALAGAVAVGLAVHTLLPDTDATDMAGDALYAALRILGGGEGVKSAGDQEHAEPVVVVVGEAAGDPAGEFDEPVHGLGAAVG